jgi:hypothetical protein
MHVAPVFAKWSDPTQVGAMCTGLSFWLFTFNVQMNLQMLDIKKKILLSSTQRLMKASITDQTHNCQLLVVLTQQLVRGNHFLCNLSCADTLNRPILSKIRLMILQQAKKDDNSILPMLLHTNQIKHNVIL